MEEKPTQSRPEEKAVRVPRELLERARRLLPKLQATAWGDALRWNETALVRLALSRGLAALEEELAAPRVPKPEAKVRARTPKGR
jgi:hypothetical protein